MRPSYVPRLRRLRLLMLLSLLLLTGFLGYWLRSEYRHERELLHADFSRILGATHSSMEDSLILLRLVKPLQEEISRADSLTNHRKAAITLPGSFSYRLSVPAPSPLNLRVQVRDGSSRGVAGDSIVIAHSSSTISRRILGDSIASDTAAQFVREIFSSSPDSPGGDQHYIVYNTAGASAQLHDSAEAHITRSIKLMIQTLAELPPAMGRQMYQSDTGALRNAFEERITRQGLSGRLTWLRDSLRLPPGAMRLDRTWAAAPAAAVTGFQTNLLRRVSAQFAFSALLLCLTTLAFGVTYRALRAQIQLSVIRNDFISNMSHELKTPVSTVKVALEAVADPGVLGNMELASEYLSMAGLELGRLELLINQALQSALLEDGRLRIERRTVDLSAITGQMARIMRPRFAQLGGTLAFSSDGSGFSMEGDALHLQGVIVNMLDNALKYAGPEPHVTIGLSQGSEELELRIVDHGPGIPAQYQARVFEKFFRVPRGNEHSVKGYGLGLSYAAQIVRLHRGRIRVGETPGGGLHIHHRAAAPLKTELYEATNTLRRR